MPNTNYSITIINSINLITHSIQLNKLINFYTLFSHQYKYLSLPSPKESYILLQSVCLSVCHIAKSCKWID